jgi:hypothetical protein
MPECQPERRDGDPRLLVRCYPAEGDRKLAISSVDRNNFGMRRLDSHAPHQSSQTDLTPSLQSHPNPNVHTHPHVHSRSRFQSRSAPIVLSAHLATLQPLQRTVVRLDVPEPNGVDEFPVQSVNSRIPLEQLRRGEETQSDSSWDEVDEDKPAKAMDGIRRSPLVISISTTLRVLWPHRPCGLTPDSSDSPRNTNPKPTLASHSPRRHLRL